MEDYIYPAEYNTIKRFIENHILEVDLHGKIILPVNVEEACKRIDWFASHAKNIVKYYNVKNESDKLEIDCEIECKK